MRRITLVLFSAICAIAQQPESATITGRVTDTSGKPIGGATLQLSGISRGRAPAPQPYTTTTASDGVYSFTGIDPGNHTLKVIRAGYIPAEVPADGSKNIDLALTPASSISGKITDENGDPVYGVVLQIWHQTRSPDGTTHLTPAQGSATTDNSGQFKIPNLQPGTFYVSANGFPLTGIPDAQLFDIVGLRVYRPPNPIFSAPPRPGQRPQAYLTAWFPTPVQITAGRDVSTIDIQLHKTPLYRVSGRVVNSPGPAHLQVMTSAGRSVNTGQIDNIAPDGSFEQNGLAPGDYDVAVLGTTMANRGLFATEKFTIADKDIDGLSITVPPPAEVRGTLTIDGKPARQPLTVSLTGLDVPPNLNGFQQSKVESDGSFTIPRAIPGMYHISAAPQGAYLTSVLLNGTEVGYNAFNLSGGSSTLRIAFTTATGQVRVNVQPDAQGVTARFVVIVPELNTPSVTWRHMQLNTAGNGVFSGVELPPGVYRIYAPGGVDENTFDPETLKQYESQSVKVTVTGGEQVVTTVTTIPQ
jgi:protocatechuate 3,4-dioxygenase beta subunit